MVAAAERLGGGQRLRHAGGQEKWQNDGRWL